jgi:uncharacterized protein
VAPSSANRYVVAGFGGDERWLISEKYGCVMAGGGSWYWKPLRNLKIGNLVFAYVGGAGYVGIGRVAGRMVRFRDLEFLIGGTIQRVIEQPDLPADLVERARSSDDETTEYAVPVTWIATCPTAIRVRGDSVPA